MVRDDEPLLIHIGTRSIFPAVCESVAELLDPATIRYIGFSHFEAGECGSLDDWLAIARNAQVVCSFVGADAGGARLRRADL